MLAEYKCGKCGEVIEEFFAVFANSPKERECLKCGGISKRLFGHPFIHSGGEVPGYEKVNQDHLTLGKAIDMRQRW